MRQDQIADVKTALPYALSYLLVPMMIWLAALGGHAGWIMALMTWGLFSLLDRFTGLDLDNPDPMTPEPVLRWYRRIVLGWVPLQFALLVGLLAFVAPSDGYALGEKLGIFFGMGVLSGTIGITYAHELMHQKSRLERRAGDALMAMVLYGHFRSEHLLVHHRHVATPKDPVTARSGESFWAFFPRVLWQCLVSSWRAEADKLARKGRRWWDFANPFWTYAAVQGALLGLAFALAGWLGVALFAFQAFVAIWQLELVNYIEHYGLSRQRLSNGKYEPVRPHHSWNAAHKASNWLLINLQRHSDHHAKPDRRFPVLQTHPEDAAPQLPHGYPIMTLAALVPPIWRRIMDPRVARWRERFYPIAAE
ncbi:MAG: alkane 1-monooxygenase [Rhodobacteraceae bacterium]|nr:alkane 1-monooxygenase [Paracoccaceae bacterium]